MNERTWEDEIKLLRGYIQKCALGSETKTVEDQDAFHAVNALERHIEKLEQTLDLIPSPSELAYQKWLATPEGQKCYIDWRSTLDIPADRDYCEP